MPLSCDCFPGCWGKHSEGWPQIEFATEEQATKARRWIIANPKAIPYGSYVSMSDTVIRLEERAYVTAVLQGAGITPTNKWVPTTNIGELRVLGKAAEETGELTSALARCIIQGIDEVEPVTGKANRKWLEEEIADVYAALEMLQGELALDMNAITQRKWVKFDKLQTWRRLLEE